MSMSPIEVEEQLPESACLDHSDACSGPVEYRMPLSGTGKAFPRCEEHWDQRLALEDRLRDRYPTHEPADVDPGCAGETWDEDD